jgi:hypothetical protein
MDYQELLTNFYLFTDATANDLRALEAIGEPRVCIAGDLVYSEGQVADALFLIEMGTVDIMPMGKERVFVTMGSGQGFGELAFFEHGRRRPMPANPRISCGYPLRGSRRCWPSDPNSRSSCSGMPVRFLRNTYAGWHSL